MGIEEEIVEGIELIAKFMGYQILHKKFQYLEYNSSNESYYAWDEGDIVCDKNGNEVNLHPDSDPLEELKELPFNSSWDWLIPVLSKLDSIGCIVQMSFALVFTCSIFKSYSPRHQFNSMEGTNGGDTPIQATFKVVVEFLKDPRNSMYLM